MSRFAAVLRAVRGVKFRRPVDVPPPAILLARFVRSVGVLALPAEDQCVWLDSLGPLASWNVDELAHEFDAGFRLSSQWVAAGWLDASVILRVAALDARLSSMSGAQNEELWTREALASDPVWEDVRHLALDALVLM